ncbi:MAG: L-aspartate oxidase [Planctomycetota bacterium]|nr:L-aspartate oxidase [Planctomycetota bacterium]
MSQGIPHRSCLSGFRSQELPIRWADVLVIGSGIAGMSAAVEAAKYGTVLLITKSKMSVSNTAWAQGGIACCLSRTEEDYLAHEEDTKKAGGNLCDEEVVSLVVREGTSAVNKLIDWGCQFDKDSSGDLALCVEGGHSQARILHSEGDATGKEISRALVETVKAHKQIRIMERAFTIDLVIHEGECHGALVWNDVQGKQLILARSTILCSGGAGRVYRETTNPKVATGDGIAMAYRAGAEIMDIEFFQFHPTTLYVAGASRSLISEAVRGEGAHLLDRSGRRFMEGVHPDKELAPRDVVSQAIIRVMKENQDTNVFLDLSPIKTDINKRFPGISLMCQRYGLDLERDRIPVRPSAHYLVGGVKTDLNGATNIPHLFAAGEVSCTGLHGANRLASNSLLEGAVFGLRAGRAAGTLAAKRIGDITPFHLDEEAGKRTRDNLDLVDLRASLGSLMWRSVGIERNRESLENTISQIEFWAGYVLSTELAGPRGWEMQNLLTVAWLISHQALAREESRGTHLRSDFPQCNPEPVHSIIKRTS